MVDNMYGINHDIKSMAVSNEFVVNMNKACYKLGQSLQPFDFYRDGVVDFAQFTGMLDPVDGSLVQEVVDYRRGCFDFQVTNDKWLFYNYLMTISACYVEIPKWVTKMGVSQPSYDKFICTRNPNIMGAWMGASPAEMQAKYTAKIRLNQVDANDGVLRCVKLNSSSKGNSITVPRSTYEVENMKCIPLFMLNAFVKGFKERLEESILKFTYLKDNGTERELCSTLNRDIIMKYYNDNSICNMMLGGVDIDGTSQGGITLSSKMSRGYIKVPELGASIYDATGTRSVNIARLTKIEVVDEIDDRYIKVDLASVPSNFNDCLDWLISKRADVIPQIAKDFMGDDYDTNKEMPSIVSDIIDYVNNRSIILSTTYHRSLHDYMVGHPDYFPYYTGKPHQAVTSSTNFGVGTMDF